MTENLFSQEFLNITYPDKNSAELAKCLEASNKLKQEIKSSELAALDIVFDSDDLKEFELAAEKSKNFKKTLILGVGGSSLGGKTLSAIKAGNNIEFLESIDPITVKKSLDRTNLTETLFIVISKSGQTIETICQLLIILDELDKAGISDYSNQFLVITEEKDSPLLKIAKKINAQILNHPKEIGGRYSCFCAVGMVPAAICGLNIKKIRIGAQKVINDFLENDDLANICAIQLELYEKGFNNNVIMPYIDNLKNFTDWYRQLWSESLGKNNFGPTPINSMGTIDQHSQLQLYLDGPKNKFFTFITAQDHGEDFFIKDLEGHETLFGNKNLSEIVQNEQETTIEVLNRKKLPIRKIWTKKLDEEILGGLMMQIFLETIIIAYSQNFNPFDQPGVEIRKNLAREILKNGNS